MMPDSSERTKTLAAVDEMEIMLSSFLTYAHAIHGNEELKPSDIGALTSSICDDLSDFGAAVTCDVESGLKLQCKRIAIKRAISNIIDNALKYGKEAKITAFRERNTIILRVDDCGPGITSGEFDSVFTPFVRGTSHSDTSTSGVGLGLSIAQMIAEDHGGEINLQNRVEGGLRVEIRLPCVG
jgi:two-component system OmpR family sensor kinase